MNIPDIINGTFQACGGLVICLSIARLIRDKRVRGFHPGQLTFYTIWGMWNLYWYPHLNQWLSFWGSLSVVGANSVYLLLIGYYSYRETQDADNPVGSQTSCCQRSPTTSQGE